MTPAPVAGVTVSRAETAAGATPAAGDSLTPTVQVSPLLSVAFVAQVLEEITMLATETAALIAPEGVAAPFVIVKTVSAPVEPGATEPRSAASGAMVRMLGRVGVPFKVTVATEAPGPLSVMVRVPTLAAVTVAAGEY